MQIRSSTSARISPGPETDRLCFELTMLLSAIADVAEISEKNSIVSSTLYFIFISSLEIN